MVWVIGDCIKKLENRNVILENGEWRQKDKQTHEDRKRNLQSN